MCILWFPCRLGKLTQVEAHWDRSTPRSRYQETGKEGGRKGGRCTKGKLCSVWLLLSLDLPAFMDAKPLPSSPSCLCFPPITLFSPYSLVAQMVKNLPAMWKTCVLSLGQEGPLEKGMATHSVFLPGESHGQRSLASYSPWAHKEPDWATNTQIPYSRIPSHGSFSVCSLSETLWVNQLQRWSRND